MGAWDVRDLLEPGVKTELLFCTQERLEEIAEQIRDQINGNGVSRAPTTNGKPFLLFEDMLALLNEHVAPRCAHPRKAAGYYNQPLCGVCWAELEKRDAENAYDPLGESRDRT